MILGGGIHTKGEGTLVCGGEKFVKFSTQKFFTCNTHVVLFFGIVLSTHLKEG